MGVLDWILDYVVPALMALGAFWLAYSRVTSRERYWICVALICLEAWFPFGVKADLALLPNFFLFDVLHNANLALIYAAICIALLLCVPSLLSFRSRSQLAYFFVVTPILYVLLYVAWLIVIVIAGIIYTLLVFGPFLDNPQR